MEQFKEYQRKYDYERNCLSNDKIKDVLLNHPILEYSQKNLQEKRVLKYQNALRFALFVLGFGMDEVCMTGEGFVVDWRAVRNSLMKGEESRLSESLDKFSHRGSRKEKVWVYQTVQSLSI